MVVSSPVTASSAADVPAGHAVPVVELGGSHVAGALVGPDGNPPVIRNLITAPVDPAASADVLLDAVLRCAWALDTPAGARWGAGAAGAVRLRRRCRLVPRGRQVRLALRC